MPTINTETNTQCKAPEQKFRYHLQSKSLNKKTVIHKRDLYLIDDDKADLFFSSHILKKSGQVGEIHQTNSPEDLFEMLNNHGLFSKP